MGTPKPAVLAGAPKGAAAEAPKGDGAPNPVGKEGGQVQRVYSKVMRGKWTVALSENRMATALAAPNAGVCAAGAPNADGVLNPPVNPPAPKVIFFRMTRAREC